MKNTPDYTEYNATIGVEVRYYCEGGKWRYVHAQGEGSGFSTLEDAQKEVKEFCTPSPDEQNDAIRKQVDAELPRPAGGFENDEQEQAWKDAQEKRFFELANSARN